MKKLILIAYMTSITLAGAMENNEQLTQDYSAQEVAVKEHIEHEIEVQASVWKRLPDDLQLLILNFATFDKDPENALEKLMNIAAECPEFRALVYNPSLLPRQIKLLAKRDKTATGRVLIKAAENGHLSVVQLLLPRCGVDYYKDDCGQTALVLAAKNGHEKVILLLLEHHACVDVKDSNGMTALMHAAANGHKKVIQLLFDYQANNSLLERHQDVIRCLLDYQINLNERDNVGKTALLYATENGHTDIVQLLLDHRAHEWMKDNSGKTALMYAAANGHTRVVQLLLYHQADVHENDTSGGTALMYAAENGHTDIVQLLLNHHAETNPKYTYERNDKGFLYERGADDIRALQKTKTALMRAAANGHIGVVQLLLNHHAWINGQDRYGKTALIYAAENNHADLVELLLKEGAVIGERALDIAMKRGHNDIIILLRAHTLLQEGLSLAKAVQKGLKEEVQLLLCCQNIHEKDSNGWTALHHAAGCGHTEIVQLLLDHGAQIDEKDSAGFTALMHAAGNGHTDVVKILLDHHANVNEKGNFGWTALMFAAFCGYKEVTQILLDYQANQDEIDDYGWTALTYATEEGHERTVSLLKNYKSSALMMNRDETIPDFCMDKKTQKNRCLIQ